MQEFYSYLWLRKDDTPYYAGKGEGNRAYKTHRRTNGRRVYPPKDHSKILIFPQLCEADAFESEKLLIDLFGRKDQSPDGLLRNLTDGGEGASGYVFSEESKAKISAASKGNQHFLGHKHTEETRAKMSAVHQDKAHSEESKAKIRAAKIGKTFSEETRKKISAALQGKTLSPEHRAKIGAALKDNQNFLGHKHTEETKLKIGAANHRRIVSIETRAKMSIAAKIRSCSRWNISRGKSCICGTHLEKAV